MIYCIKHERIIYSTPTRMALKGGVTENNAVIKAVASDLREFLTPHRGNHIGQEELESFYRRHFPKAKLNIIDGRSTMSKGTNTAAESSVGYTDDMKGIREFQIFIHSKSPMDTLKWLFAVENNKKPFYVTDRFIKIYIHEFIHFMQRYLKPIDKSIQTSMVSHSFGRKDNFNKLQQDILEADRSLVYKSEIGENFSPENFRENIMELLNKPKYASYTLVKDELKFLIRHAQSEKQAHEIEMEEAAIQKQPKLIKNKQQRDIIIEQIKKKIDATFKFEDKIRIMKEEYFRLIQQERDKNQLYLEIINS